MDDPQLPRDIASAAARDRILDVAERLMAQKGYAGTSIGTICKDSGFPVGSIYHHFGSKVGLLRAVLVRGSHQFFQQLPGARSSPGSPEERIVAHYRAAAQTILNNMSFFRIDAALLLQPSEDPEVRDLMNEMRAEAVRQVSAILGSIAEDTGVQDAAALGRHLADLTIVFTRGTVCELATDTTTFRHAFDGFGRMVWTAIVQSVPGSVDPRGSLPIRSAG